METDILREIVIPCLCSFIACCAFGVQFNIKVKHLIAASVGSLVSELVYDIFTVNGFSEIKCCFIAAIAVSVYSEIMARSLKAPVNMYLIVGIIPLVPGALTYYTMIALVMGDSETFFSRGASALGAAVAIAMGIFTVSSVFRVATGFYRQFSQKFPKKKKPAPKHGKGVNTKKI